MAIITYTRSAASASWIDARTGLPEVDRLPPGQSVRRSFLTGQSGFRFVNFIEVWARFDTARGSIVGHGFTPASGVYRSPSFAGIPSQVFQPIRSVKVGREPITFTQIIGCRTQSPEQIGGMVFGPLGNIAASAASAFPPIWSEITIKIYNDGQIDASLLRHSIFPSLSYYTRPTRASGSPNESGPYQMTPVGGFRHYDAVSHLARWKESGWGNVGAGIAGPTQGNPWGFAKSVFTGIDHTQPFGW